MPGERFADYHRRTGGLVEDAVKSVLGPEKMRTQAMRERVLNKRLSIAEKRRALGLPSMLPIFYVGDPRDPFK